MTVVCDAIIKYQLYAERIKALKTWWYRFSIKFDTKIPFQLARKSTKTAENIFVLNLYTDCVLFKSSF